MMALTGISKNYAGVHALTDVSLEIHPGQVHALLGENGAGKSTLMGVASGTTEPDAGTITFGGVEQSALTPAIANSLGIAIVHQHPALLPDMTVAENIRLGVPKAFLRSAGDETASIQALLTDVGLTVHLKDRVSNLTVAQKHLLEVAKALAVSPKLLILDEPTAPLGKESVDLLFEHVRSIARGGTAVVYITHRLAEVRLLADRVTVLRDGKVSGTADVSEVTDDQLLAWIVGRQLDSTFPPKHDHEAPSEEYLKVSELTGTGFSDISISAERGEIVGLAGVVGNGQSELLAALAGLGQFTGTVEYNQTTYTPKLLRNHSAYMPADRHQEGLMMTLSVRENTAISALSRFRRGGFLRRSSEEKAVAEELRSLDVKTPSMETNIASLSGGNQQKVVLARALLSQPVALIADEPTQGVDVGARAEIYRILREVAESGIPVIVASSDAKELEGLCDRVIVLSRGHAVVELTGSEITEERIIHAAVSATTHRKEQERPGAADRSSRRGRVLQGDYVPVAILAAVILVLGAYIFTQNDRYISAFNITSVLMLVAALGFISMGQTMVLMTGGIDLSVGPLSGFLVVVASFFVNNDQPLTTIILGFVAMIAAAIASGATNGLLIRLGKFTPVAATLTVFIALQGLSFVLRSSPGGLMNSTVTGLIMTKVGPVPLAFLILVAVTIGLEYSLRNRPWGLKLRAIGSDEESARRLGVKTGQTLILAYIAAALVVFLGAIVLIAQLGIGDPAQGIGYTLSSVTAVVLGGTSLLGGRGTFVGTLFGSFLIVQVLNATVFLGLDQTWQYFFQGALIMVAAIAYSQVRGLRQAT